MPSRSESLAKTIRSVTDHWDEPLDEVHDVPQIVNALLAQEVEEDQRLDGFDAAVSVIEERFFGGPTKDMVLQWLAEARAELGKG